MTMAATQVEIPATPDTVTVDDLSIDLERKTVEVAGSGVNLTEKEYQTVEVLFLNGGTISTKRMFLQHLYRGKDEPEMKIIEVFVCKVRKKLRSASGGKDYIETVWGRGYRLRNPQVIAEGVH